MKWHPEYKIADNFWFEGKEDRAVDLAGLWAGATASRKFRRLHERILQEDENLSQQEVVTRYKAIQRQNKRLKIGVCLLAGTVACVASALLIKESTEQSSITAVEQKAAATEALRDPFALHTLGICATELRAQKAFIQDREQNKMKPDNSPSSVDFGMAAHLAELKHIGCTPEGGAEARYTIGAITFRPETLIDFNLADACKDSDQALLHPRQYTDDINRGLIAQQMAFDAGMSCMK